MNTFDQPTQSFTPEQPPVNEENNEQHSSGKGTPSKKLKYFWTEGPTKVKALNWSALAAGIIAAILIIFSAFSAINSHILDLPFLKMVIPENELKEVRTTLDTTLEEIDKAIAESDQEMIQDFENEYGISIKTLREAFDPLSIKNLSKLFSSFDNSEFAQLAQISSILSTAIVGFAIFICVLMALAVAFVKKGLMIFAYILSIAFLIMMAGMTMFLIVTAIVIAYIVLTTLLNTEYKKYKRSFKR